MHSKCVATAVSAQRPRAPLVKKARRQDEHGMCCWTLREDDSDNGWRRPDPRCCVHQVLVH
eukprot:11032215-Lingulodinium_polyedra.AAC.1